MPLRILVVDDHAVVRRGVRALLESHTGWEVCGEATNGRDAVEETLRLRPDIVHANSSKAGTMRMTNSQNMGRPVRNKCTMAKRVRAVVSMAAIGILHVAIKRGAPRIILDLGMRGKPAEVESRLFCDRILN